MHPLTPSGTLSPRVNLRYPATDPEIMTRAGRAAMFHRAFLGVFLAIAVVGVATWLAIFEHNYHPRIYRYSPEVTILQVGDSEVDFDHPEGAFSIWWQSGRRNVRVWVR